VEDKKERDSQTIDLIAMRLFLIAEIRYTLLTQRAKAQ
jgi:hypothetical protein